MKNSDKSGFKAKREDLDLEQYLILTYFFESQTDPEEAALHLCQEQSTAQWKRVGVEEDFRPKHGAKLLNLDVLQVKNRPFFDSPFHKGPKFYNCRATIAHPHINFGNKIPNMLTMLQGEGTFYTPGIITNKLIDIVFPETFLRHFQGPQFGLQGVRSLLHIHDRPLFFGVVKPNIGLSPADFAELAYQSWLGGLDIAKDDEMLADDVYSPLKERTHLLGKLLKKAGAETGKKKMFLANITDEIDKIQANHDIAVANGINAVMLCPSTTGLSAARTLRKNAKVPLVGHFAGMTPFTQIPFFGMSSRVWIQLQRLTGFDIILFPGVNPRMHTTEKEMLENIKVCLEPLGSIKPALPIIGGSIWAGTLSSLYQKIGHINFGVVSGRGIFNHPKGPRSGAKSLCQAWESIQKKVPPEEYAKTHVELQQAIEVFGD